MKQHKKLQQESETLHDYLQKTIFVFDTFPAVNYNFREMHPGFPNRRYNGT